MTTERRPDAEAPPPRRTILAPLPDETPLKQSSPAADPAPAAATQARRDSSRERGVETSPERRRPRAQAAKEEKRPGSTKTYLWRRNVRFLDNVVMTMEDNGARPGDINRSVVLRAVLTALEKAGLGRDLARCTNEDELAELIVARFSG